MNFYIILYLKNVIVNAICLKAVCQFLFELLLFFCGFNTFSCHHASRCISFLNIKNGPVKKQIKSGHHKLFRYASTISIFSTDKKQKFSKRFKKKTLALNESKQIYTTIPKSCTRIIIIKYYYFSFTLSMQWNTFLKLHYIE